MYKSCISKENFRITNDLKRRIFERQNKLVDGFTKKYGVNKLVYYEAYDTAYNEISREKQIKSGSRQRKMDLINQENKNWEDLYNKL